MDKEEKAQKRKFWNATRIIFALFLLVGILVGAIVMHFFIEPQFFTRELQGELETKTDEWKAIQDQYIECMKKLGTCGETT